MSTPELQLGTLFELNGSGRIEGLREPGSARGPVFALIRSETSCAWAIRADVAGSAATEFERLVRDEPPVTDLREPPRHADSYLAVAADWAEAGEAVVSFGPAFTFPDRLARPDGISTITDEVDLDHSFQGWYPGEIASGRGPVLAIVENDVPVSICFCARRSGVAAEAGLETAAAFRGRGFGGRVAAAWALEIRASGRIPLYSTGWSNAASLSVARKLGLTPYACDWSISV